MLVVCLCKRGNSDLVVNGEDSMANVSSGFASSQQPQIKTFFDLGYRPLTNSRWLVELYPLYNIHHEYPHTEASPTRKTSRQIPPLPTPPNGGKEHRIWAKCIEKSHQIRNFAPQGCSLQGICTDPNKCTVRDITPAIKVHVQHRFSIRTRTFSTQCPTKSSNNSKKKHTSSYNTFIQYHILCYHLRTKKHLTYHLSRKTKK